jgi:MFS family permease
MSPPASITHTLRHDTFRGLAAGGAVYFVGNAMQVMATTWEMVEASGSGLLAALVQTAAFLPMFLLSLPAGVLADTTDRRRLILAALVVQAVAVALLAALLAADLVGPTLLLGLTFVCGCSTALLTPAWNSTITDSVPRDELPQAITIVGIAYNAARALGPTAGGFLFAHLGGPAVFLAALAGTLVMLRSVRRHPPRPHPPSRLPAERLWGGMLAALRYAWHAQPVFAQLLRITAYSAAGSALWALLPVIGQKRIGLGASGFGLLMGCLGLGAIAAGLSIGRLRLRASPERIVVASCVLFALATAVAAWSPWIWPIYAALAASGAAWMATMSTFNTATLTSAPPWVKARASAMHVLCALGAFAIGSALWGAVSSLVGLQAALSLSALAVAAGLLLVRPFPLRMGAAEDVTPAAPFHDLFVAEEPAPEAGPVAVEIAYRVRAADEAAFLDALTLLRAPRRRDGATFWRIYRDLADPTRFVERFIVASWADYLHQRARSTLADQELEARVRAFVREGEAVTMQHYVAER